MILAAGRGGLACQRSAAKRQSTRQLRGVGCVALAGFAAGARQIVGKPDSYALRAEAACAKMRQLATWLASLDRSHAPRGSTSPDAPRRLLGDAERHGLHSRAERGNDPSIARRAYDF